MDSLDATRDTRQRQKSRWWFQLTGFTIIVTFAQALSIVYRVSPGSRRGVTIQSRRKLPLAPLNDNHTAPHRSSLSARSARAFENLTRRTPSGAKPTVATGAERDRLMGIIRGPKFLR